MVQYRVKRDVVGAAAAKLIDKGATHLEISLRHPKTRRLAKKLTLLPLPKPLKKLGGKAIDRLDKALTRGTATIHVHELRGRRTRGK